MCRAGTACTRKIVATTPGNITHSIAALHPIRTRQRRASTAAQRVATPSRSDKQPPARAQAAAIVPPPGPWTAVGIAGPRLLQGPWIAARAEGREQPVEGTVLVTVASQVPPREAVALLAAVAPVLPGPAVRAVLPALRVEDAHEVVVPGVDDAGKHPE